MLEPAATGFDFAPQAGPLRVCFDRHTQAGCDAIGNQGESCRSQRHILCWKAINSSMESRPGPHAMIASAIAAHVI
jgi:hypothetical protein